MLTQATAQSLGLKGNFSHFPLTLPSFQSSSPLWQKDKSSMLKQKKSKRFEFYKYGKSLGMEVTRYLQYINGRLYYFQNANDKESKGQCVLENLYFYYFSLGKNFVMHLTNGQQYSTFYFHDNNFFSTCYNQLIKSVIQVDFNERYQLIEQIGQGTFSKVYFGINKFTNRTFAIKVMPKVDETGFQTKHLAFQEKRVLRLTKTCHLCGMEQFFQDNFNYIFVLQFIGGQDLSKILKQQKIMSTNENIFILKEVLKGLQDLHELNIIHRDLKPHNIIIDSKERIVKIVDFGLSLLVDSATTLKQFMRCGTMGYIAPEIVNNQTNNRKPYNCKSDMFAFGIIAHMLLQGTNPMRARTYKDTVDRNIKCNFVIEEKQILLSYGRDCLDLIKGCLNKDPQLRPTAKQALENSFFQEKQLDQKTVTNKDLNEDQVFGNKISEVNYVEDKEVIGDKSNSSKFFNISQICTPKKTIPTGRSMSSRSKLSGFSGIM